MKKIIVVLLALVIGGVGIYWLRASFAFEPRVRPVLQCETARMTYYYRPECIWCQRIATEQTIAQVEALGVDVKKINARTGAVPRFLINNEIHTGFQTTEQLKELLGC